jgi:hypothetical protein
MFNDWQNITSQLAAVCSVHLSRSKTIKQHGVEDGIVRISVNVNHNVVIFFIRVSQMVVEEWLF